MDDALYLRSKNKETRWASFENPLGKKGQGGMENGGGKGHAFDKLDAGKSQILTDVEGSGTIDRIWITISDRTPEILRSVKIEFFWDQENKPAVSVPLGDFFGAALGKTVKFESMFLSNPEGRSFNSFFKMPFLKGAKIVLTNESKTDIGHLFYDVCYTLCPMDKDTILYFHAYWNRENPVELEKDYTILPVLKGEGKYLGTMFGVLADQNYETSWFGEGEMKFYLDGDDQYPTLCGTGTEDYIGTAWGQGEYANMTQGCLLSDLKQGYIFYRFHARDPVYFYKDIRVQIQTIGGAEKYTLLRFMDQNVPVKIVSRDGTSAGEWFEPLYEEDFVLERGSKAGWYNYYRQDDFSSTAYFYYTKPVSDLPDLPKVEVRTAGLS